MNNKHIYITGFMGTGKSRIGKLLASSLNLDFVDTDDLIENKYNKTVKQIFETEGSKRFRDLELKIIEQISEDKIQKVISLGGGTLLNPQNQIVINQIGILIYIKAGLEEIWNRVKHKNKRPLLMRENKMLDKSEFMIHALKLMYEREKGYKNADFVINRDGFEAEEVVDLILNKLKLNY